MDVISLFSGAGGLDLGLIQAGHRIVWANDIYEDAVATYRRNIGNHVDVKDIYNISSSDIPDGDVVVGGFPCQGFSVANWNRTTGDKRNKLYREMVRVIRDKRPRFFIAENVKGIVSLGKGEVLKRIIGDFRSTGYKTYWKVLNSADFGVPQKRMRFVMLGVREDIFVEEVPFPPKPTHVEPGKGSLGQLLPWVTVGEALAHYPEPDDAPDIPNHDYSKYKLRFNGHLGHRYIDPNQPAPTVTGRGDDKGGVVVLHHPNNHRRMSARELATVQSFPDDFVFEGTRTSAYRQIANAVPPKLGQAIGRMLNAVEEKSRVRIAEAV
ncbi:DNA (cytosine-5-)-methyltransferase [Pseudodesulfovibrio sp. F-1]|uniref:Cytosine-specific methyltransferase n=1 Tax=Pseudodesulfovibrio alkaliphilus TaxID=2661613 RepID=A0A7K1KNA3_9BACT|nr:DNA cytosine methyltransferase [Pseudodesulfovibrio alkaliphilus]MUM77565.1 DNA (cytosine-5-)-methyltransferase [Pseudodesulfovibrio alkaliphilus]